VKLYREEGTISVKECEQFSLDTQAVRDQKMALDEYKGKLTAGKYYRSQANGYCAKMVFPEEDVRAANTVDEIPWSKVRTPVIRKLSASGGFSSITKAYIRPTIPFQFSFGKDSVTVNVMTLFHPSPIRIENVQHDAVLTLGDMSDPTAKVIVLIPLEGSLNSGTSGQFLARIASYIPGILRPGPTGIYEPVDAPTGKDWSLSQLLPVSPGKGVTVGYFSWSSIPPLEEYEKRYVRNPGFWPDQQYMGWRSNGPSGPRFVMLEKPIPVNPFDLQTIKMLPVTPSDEALPPPIMRSLVYVPPKTCPKTPTSADTKETFTTASLDLPTQTDVCDPFAGIPPKDTIDGTFILQVLAGVLATGAVFIGIYFALKYATKPEYADKFKQWGEAFGRQIASAKRVASQGMQKATKSTAAATQRISQAATSTKQSISNKWYERQRQARRQSAPAQIRQEIQKRDRRDRARTLAASQLKSKINQEQKKREAELAAKKRMSELEEAAKQKAAEAAAKKKAEEEVEAKKKAEEEAERDRLRKKSLLTYRSSVPKTLRKAREKPIRIDRAPRDDTRRRPPPPVLPSKPKPGPIPQVPNQAAIDARVQSAKEKVQKIAEEVKKRKEAEEKAERETKERLAAARKRISEITDATRKRKEQEETKELEERMRKYEEDARIAKEQAARDLEDARVRLRRSMESVRRAQKKGGRKGKNKTKIPK
jgi:hypothetical protein